MMAIRCFKLAALYLLLGLTLGVFMGATRQFALMPVHAHINLLGWTLLLLAGLLFARFPQLAATRLAQAFFWIFNISVPISMLLLAFELTGHPGVGPFLGVASMGMWLGGVCLALNILSNLRQADLA